MFDRKWFPPFLLLTYCTMSFDDMLSKFMFGIIAFSEEISKNVVICNGLRGQSILSRN